MNLITVEGLTHSYTDRMLFKEASFSLNEHEKVGIIGINGTGKSTLLKILAGQEIPDQGTMITRRNLRIAYLPQQPEFEPGETMLMGALPRKEEISGNPAEYEADAKSYLGKLGLTQYDQPVSQLSGGQRKRVALVRVLLTPCDVLVLDEPTNHLDGAMSQWLEDHLKNMKTELIMVTHDRYFLDSVVNRIVEIDKGSLYSYSCNYSGFLERKAEREEIEKATERKRQSVLRKEIAWMQRGARARSTKQKAHIARYEMLRDQEAPEQDRQVEIVAGSSRLGKTTIECENIWKGYDDRAFDPGISTYDRLRHDRVGIIGPNGCGKSTLIETDRRTGNAGSGPDHHRQQTAKIRVFFPGKRPDGPGYAGDRLCERRGRGASYQRGNHDSHSVDGASFCLQRISSIPVSASCPVARRGDCICCGS